MFNNKKRLVLVSFCGLLSSQVFAGLYVQGQVGAAGIGGNNNFFDNIFDNEFDLKATGRISAGYLWHANPCLKVGLETGFQGYSNLTIEDSDDFLSASYKYKRSTFDVLGVLDYSANSKINLFAKAGPAYVMQKETISFADNYYNYSFTDSSNVVVPKAAVGVGYNINPALNVNLSFNHEFKKDSDNKFAGSESSILAGVVFKYS
jgi:opacity protein-like surface antigen